MTARRRSLFYLERLRILHASITIVLTIGLLAWAIRLWEQGAVTTGDVVMACTLGLSVLHATRDLAVALVDVTQHVARLSEALLTLLVPHQLRDHPEAKSFVHRGASVALENISFSYPDGTRVFEDLSLRHRAGPARRPRRPVRGGKSSLFALIQRFYDLRAGRIVIDGQDIARVTRRACGRPSPSCRRTLPVSPLGHGQHPIWQAGGKRRRGPRSRRLRELSWLHRSAAAGLFDHRRRSGRETVGRSAAAHRASRARFSRMRLCFSSMRRRRRSTVTPSRRSRMRSTRLMPGRTVIMIAHRLSSARNFDRIVVIEAGQTVQDGAPEQLTRQDGVYRALIDNTCGSSRDRSLDQGGFSHPCGTILRRGRSLTAAAHPPPPPPERSAYKGAAGNFRPPRLFRSN